MDIEKTGQGSAEPAGVGVAPSLLHAADAVSLAKYDPVSYTHLTLPTIA